MLVAAILTMLAVFGQIPLNDAIVGKYCADEYRGRVYAVRYVVTFCVAAVAVPLISVLHATPGGFRNVFLVLAALAVAVLAAGLFFPSRLALRRQAVAA
jgi:MFS family permease